MNLIPVILSGGSGSRLWPQSRSLYPKQFLPLVNNKTMFQNTVSRLDGLTNVSEPLVIANEEHRFLVAEQFRQMDQNASAIILEPVGRNTAPAVALAAIKSLQVSGSKSLAVENEERVSENPESDPVLLVLAADHVINDVAAFHRAIDIALPAAIAGKLVTFGVVPTHAETGYGYIKANSEQKDEPVNRPLNTDFQSVFTVDHFVEKPNLESAEQYLASGNYFWNSGMFMFKASRYLEELKAFHPEILKVCEKSIAHEHPDLDFVRLNEDEFNACPDDSIDYAVMEKTADAVVVPLDAGWSDVGSWSSLWDISAKDEQSNSVQGDVILHDTHNTYVRSEKKLIATVGVDGLIISESDDAILISTKDRVQDVKKIVEKLKREGRSEAKLHRKVYRPWGAYDSIDCGERFQVKRITVKPGAKLSLQKHYHRAEHWIVVKGTALVTNGDEVTLLTENQSTYIPIGVAHRLENPGKFDLELIEVQSGSYLGEDDIVRFDDIYGCA
ncbi:mannose-1-phosphate guanylyltransferase/mannose-6-phosphate isomerase [Endozoicomonas arenosclerae]|uniref:mannose-1-phosphate guanylyltransferase/mannose-6-phosphate isomerase n=1 Tax=Endozoicomonas arenosclerae TaxID=1633495 RepID=UPI000783E38D|nr:mannose-1-phosphate guanylyltransferase/mannose-6-phosphate isomerase [Endozoicomonas arenosclerae]